MTLVLQCLAACTILEFIIALFVFKGDILSPAIAFSFVFVVATLDLILMTDMWQVSLQPITLIVIVTGITAFIFGGYCGKRGRATNIRIKGLHLPSYVENFKISKNFLNLMVVIYAVFIPLTMVYIITSRGMSAALSGLISTYASAIGGDTDLVLPIYLEIPGKILGTAGYAWAYLLVNHWIINRKFEMRLVALYAFTLLMSVSNGKRGELIALAFALIVFMLLALKKNENRKIKRKVYFILLIVLLAVSLSFQGIATTMGRDSYLFEPLEYFSIYLGAPIMNLDKSIKIGSFSHPTFLSETFLNLYNSIGENFGLDSWIYKTDRVFLSSANGRRVGNVDTIFYDFYHDGGLLCVVVMSFIMGFIVHRIYKRLTHNQYKNKMFYSILYAYVFWLVVRSFFANSFYAWFTLSTIETLLLWWFYSVTISKLH